MSECYDDRPDPCVPVLGDSARIRRIVCSRTGRNEAEADQDDSRKGQRQGSQFLLEGLILNMSESIVQKWEPQSGVKCANGMALKLLNVVQKHGLKILT